MLNQDTDRTQAIYLKNLSPTWVKQLDEEVGKHGMFCDIKAIFRGMCRPITTLKLRLTEKNN
jgi:hypothetical protein